MANDDEIQDDPTATNESKLEALRAALVAGERSGVAEGDVIAEVRERIRQRYGSLSNRELTAAADELFQELDRHEQHP
jgi:hypothetical protein